MENARNTRGEALREPIREPVQCGGRGHLGSSDAKLDVSYAQPNG